MAEKYGKKVRELMIKEMEEVFGKKGFIFSSYDKIKASDIDAFRREVRGAGSKYFMIKKTLGKISLQNKGLTGLDDVFDHQKNVGAAVIEEDPVIVAKILSKFAKENKNFSIASGCLDGRVLTAEKIKELSELPGREQLLAMVLGTLNAPITGFVGVLSAVTKKILYVLNAIKEKKESGN